MCKAPYRPFTIFMVRFTVRISSQGKHCVNGISPLGQQHLMCVCVTVTVVTGSRRHTVNNEGKWDTRGAETHVKDQMCFSQRQFSYGHIYHQTASTQRAHSPPSTCEHHLLTAAQTDFSCFSIRSLKVHSTNQLKTFPIVWDLSSALLIADWFFLMHQHLKALGFLLELFLSLTGEPESTDSPVTMVTPSPSPQPLGRFLSVTDRKSITQ